MKNNGRKSDLSHRYHTRVIANIIYSTLVACLIDVFLVTNLTMLAEYAKRSEQSSAFLNMVAQSDVVVVLVYVLVGILAFAVTFLLLQEKSAAVYQPYFRCDRTNFRRRLKYAGGSSGG